MKALFTAIQNRLISEVTELKMIDFDLGQTDMEPLPPLDYPAALISFGESPFTDLGGRTQQAQAMIIVRLVFRVFERTSSVAASQYRAVGLAHLDVVDKIKWALHGFAGDDFTPISHRSFATEPRADLRVYTQIFETLLTDSPPADQVKYISWGDAGGSGAGPDLCAQDEDGNPIT